jgi:hypothetical protein
MILLRIMILRLIFLIDVLGVRNCENTLARNTGHKCLEVKGDKISIWSLIFLITF